MKVTKLFKSGGSQAVRLPKEFRFKGSEVYIEREGLKVDRFLSVLNIVPFDRTVAAEAAKLRHDLESTGTRIGPYDLLIAAQAISTNCTLVTANVREFVRIKSLKVENWRVG